MRISDFKTIGVLVPILIISLYLLNSCNSDQEIIPQTYEYFGAWASVPGESNQDVLVFNLREGVSYELEVTDITGTSDVSLAVYPPGIPLGGVNLLTLDIQEYNCFWGVSGQDVTETVEFTAPMNGSYQIAVTRFWGTSMGLEGTYRMALVSSEPFEALGLAANDQASLATGYTCP